MNSKLAIPWLIVTMTVASCNSETSNPDKAATFVSQLTQLKEFKIEEKRADSLKRAGADIEFQVGVIEHSPFPEDSLKNYSVGLIEYNFGPDELMLYKVKYDKVRQEIVSVEKTYTEADFRRYGLLKDNQ